MPTNRKYTSLLSGFTLIEVIIVVAIIGVFSSIMFVNFKSWVIKSQDSKRKADLVYYHNIFENYYNDKGCYPTSAQWQSATCNGATFLSPYMSQLRCDPLLKSKYIYQATDKAGNECVGECGACTGYRLLTTLANTDDQEIKKVGCSPTTGCGIIGPNGEIPNWGVSSVATVPAPGFDPN